jgi:hypothetical protein
MELYNFEFDNYTTQELVANLSSNQKLLLANLSSLTNVPRDFFENVKNLNVVTNISDLTFYVILTAYLLVILIGTGGNILVIMAVSVR